MEKIADLIDMKKAAPVAQNSSETEKKTPTLDAKGRAYATGKRKDSIARVWLKPGKGEIIVNHKNIEDYFGRAALRMIIKQPLVATNSENMDIYVTATGGGLSGQAGAIKHGISKALAIYDPNCRPVLRQGGFLTRDSRVVERKKYGLKKARRSFQFSKR